MNFRPISSPERLPKAVWKALAALSAATIFLIDALTQFDVAVAVLYVVVVVMAANFASRRGLLLITWGCALLTVSAFLLVHAEHYSNASLARCVVSLAAITITGSLVAKNRQATIDLSEQAGLLNLSHDAIFVRDMHDRIRFWNRGAEELYGLPQGEATGRCSHELLHTRFDMPLAQLMEVLLRDGRWEGELIQQRADGSELTVASRWSLWRDEHGRPLAILESHTDITERKRAELKVLEQERRLRMALDNIPALVWTGTQQGQIDYANAHWQERGFDPAMLRHGWSEVVHPEDRAAWQQRLQQAHDEGKVFEAEARLRLADGSYRWFLHRAVPVCDAEGRVGKWYAASTDIEARKVAEQRTAQAERELRQVTDTVPALLWTATPDAHILYVNSRWADIGFCLEDVQGLRWKGLIHPEDLPGMYEDMRRARGDKFDYENISRVLHRNGEYRWTLIRGRALLDEHGEPVRWYCINTDIEDHRRAEDALHRSQAELAHAARVATLGELTASIAHEVNQPLAAVVTNGEASLRWLNRAEPQLEEVRNGLNRVISEGRRASEVIKRLRALARKGDTQKTTLQCAEVIEEMLTLVQREVVRHRVTLTVECAPDLPPISGDRVQLQQVLINLAVNAIQAMAQVHDRPRELGIATHLGEDGMIHVAVRDTGDGIAEADLDRLFSAFFTTKQEGMGMGLSICRSIIDAHGGKIWASSTPGQGSLFQFVLPVEQVVA